MKLDHSVIPVKRVLTVEDGLENPLTGVAIYLLRTSTKRTLGEETFQREIMCGMLNAQVKTFFPNPRTFLPDCLASDGRVRIIIIFLRFFPTTSCHSVIRTHVSRPAPDWDALPTELPHRDRERKGTLFVKKVRFAEKRNFLWFSINKIFELQIQQNLNFLTINYFKLLFI